MLMAVYTDDGFCHSVKNRIEAKYLIYAQRAGHHTVRMPKAQVEISRAVSNYERYLRELRQELFEAYYKRTLDQRTATRLVAAAWQQLNLPPVEEV